MHKLVPLLLTLAKISDQELAATPPDACLVRLLEVVCELVAGRPDADATLDRMEALTRRWSDAQDKPRDGEHGRSDGGLDAC